VSLHATALLLFASCGQSYQERDYINRNGEVNWESVQASPRWFKTDLRYQSKDQQGQLQSHPFYDLSPYINYPERTVSFYVTTKVEDHSSYGLDIVSGRRYKKHALCVQKDVWEKYDDDIYLPPFTEGILPRVLDEIGQPQMIRVFGRESFYAQEHGVASHQVKVVGGVLEQVCPSPPCKGPYNWVSRLVLIAVDPIDPKFKNVTDFEGLKKVVDWDYAMAFMQNAHGTHFANQKRYPAYRISGEIKSGFALRFATSYSHVFTLKELMNMRSGCYKLYDYTWNLLKNDHIIEKVAEQKADVIHATGSVQIPSKKTIRIKTEFYDLFKEWFSKFGHKYQTCSDYVATSNINDNPERHWFFTYLTAFFRVQRLGYLYSCSKNSWVVNPAIANGKRKFNPAKEFQSCNANQTDHAFLSAVNTFVYLYQNYKSHYRYIEYDNGIDGTHEKIYSWVQADHKHFVCEKSDFKVYGDSAQTIFPDDVRWKMVESRIEL